MADYKVKPGPDSHGNPGEYHVYSDHTVFVAAKATPAAAPINPQSTPIISVSGAPAPAAHAPAPAPAPTAQTQSNTVILSNSASYSVEGTQDSHGNPGVYHVYSDGRKVFVPAKATPAAAPINPQSTPIISVSGAPAPAAHAPAPAPAPTAQTQSNTVILSNSASYSVEGTQDSHGNPGVYHVYSDGRKVFVPAKATPAAAPINPQSTPIISVSGAPAPAYKVEGTQDSHGNPGVYHVYPDGHKVFVAANSSGGAGNSQQSTGGLILNNVDPLHKSVTAASHGTLLVNGEPVGLGGGGSAGVAPPGDPGQSGAGGLNAAAAGDGSQQGGGGSGLGPDGQGVDGSGDPPPDTGLAGGDGSTPPPDPNQPPDPGLAGGDGSTPSTDDTDNSQDPTLGGADSSTDNTDNTDTTGTDQLSGGTDTSNTTDSGSINLQPLASSADSPFSTSSDGSTTINAGPVTITTHTDGSKSISDGPLTINTDSHGIPSFSSGGSDSTVANLSGSANFPATSSYSFPNSPSGGSESTSIPGIAAAGGISADITAGETNIGTQAQADAKGRWSRLNPRNWGSSGAAVASTALPDADNTNSAVVGSFSKPANVLGKQADGWGANADVPPDPANGAIAVDRRHHPNPLDDNKENSQQS